MSVQDRRLRIAEIKRQDPDPPTPEEEAETLQYAQEMMVHLGRESDPLSVLLLSAGHRVVTRAVPTLAVSIAGDGFVALLLNPDFCAKLRDEYKSNPKALPTQGVFVFAHEAMHVFFEDLNAKEAHIRHPDWRIASEAVNNWFTSKLLGMGLPIVDGERTGVDPDEVYRDYKKDLESQGLTPVAKEKMFASSIGCLRELQRMSKPPSQRQRKRMICPTGAPGANGGSASGEGGQSQSGDGQQAGGKGDDGDDQDGAGNGDDGDNDDGDDDDGDGKGMGQRRHPDGRRLVVSDKLETALHDAIVNDNKDARKALENLIGATEGSETASKLWGDLGAEALRGEAPAAEKRSNYWWQWLEQQIGSRLTEGMRLVYRRKIPWNPQLGFVGDEEMLEGVLAVDTSGSMRQEVIDWVLDKCGQHENLALHHLAFDAVAHPFELGGEVRGGGGTSFQAVVDWIDEQLEDQPDFVLVITDGYAPAITPPEPENWIWLITPGGSRWPEEHDPPMSTFELPHEPPRR